MKEASFKVQYHVNSLFNSMSYAFKGIIVDPGDMWEGFNNVSKVLLTHAHFDHIYGLNSVIKFSPEAKVFTNEKGKEMLLNTRKNLSIYNETPFVFDYPDRIVIVKDSEEINLGNDLTAKAIFTPGHNPSCITWIIRDAVFTGDAYIPGIKTVTNLPGGNRLLATSSELKIQKISSERVIYPGHLI